MESVDASDLIDEPRPSIPLYSEAEADDEREDIISSKRSKPATKRSLVRNTMEQGLKRNPPVKKGRSPLRISIDNSVPRSNSHHLLDHQTHGRLQRSLLSKSLESLHMSDQFTPPGSSTPTTPTRNKRMSLPTVTPHATLISMNCGCIITVSHTLYV